MDVCKLVVCMVLWSISTSTLSAPQSSSNVFQGAEVHSASLPGVQVFDAQQGPGSYWVQVSAATVSPSTTRYTRLFSDELVVVHQGRDNIHRVMIGPLQTFAAGVRARQKARESGISDAFLRFSERPYEETPSRYWVQLYSTKNPVRYASLLQLRALPQIKIIRSDNGYNRVLAGPFGSYQEAETIRLQSKGRGMDSAFVLTL